MTHPLALEPPEPGLSDQDYRELAEDCIKDSNDLSEVIEIDELHPVLKVGNSIFVSCYIRIDE